MSLSSAGHSSGLREQTADVSDRDVRARQLRSCGAKSWPAQRRRGSRRRPRPAVDIESLSATSWSARPRGRAVTPARGRHRGVFGREPRRPAAARPPAGPRSDRRPVVWRWLDLHSPWLTFDRPLHDQPSRRSDQADHGSAVSRLGSGTSRPRSQLRGQPSSGGRPAPPGRRPSRRQCSIHDDLDAVRQRGERPRPRPPAETRAEPLALEELLELGHGSPHDEHHAG